MKAKAALPAGQDKVGDSAIGQVKKFIQDAGSTVVIYKVFDKADNDGDGCTDEELLDGLDNDGDGKVDEDSRGAPDTAGNVFYRAEKDLADNPRKLKFIPLEAAQLPRSLGDTEYAIINGNFAISSGLKLTEAVALEKTPDHYLNVVAVKRADEDTPWAKDIVEVYRSNDFKAVVNAKFQGYAKPSFLQ